MGTKKGSLIFVSLLYPKQLLARFSFHIKAIKKIDFIWDKNASQYKLISVCEENILKLIYFNRGINNAEVILQLNLEGYL